MDILSILLSRGADPNLVIESEGTTLRPVLAEYLASNVQLSPQVIHMLLKFGARVSSTDRPSSGIEHVRFYPRSLAPDSAFFCFPFLCFYAVRNVRDRGNRTVQTSKNTNRRRRTVGKALQRLRRGLTVASPEKSPATKMANLIARRIEIRPLHFPDAFALLQIVRAVEFST